MFGVSGLLAVLALVLALAAPASAQERDYTTITPPDDLGNPSLPTTASAANGINARGDVVGTFIEGSGLNAVQHGFLFSKGKFAVIDFPGAQGTIARGINPRGEIVGNYWLAGDPVVASRGFLRTKEGDFVPVRFPEHSWETLQRILPDGTILGCRHDNDLMQSMRGVVIGKDRAWDIDAFSSMNNGATPDLRLMVGWWVDMMSNPPLGQTQGYMIQDGVFTPFLVPDSTATQAWDVNPDGVIVGFYRLGRPPTATFRGFVKIGDNYTTIQYPELGTTATRVFGINPRGDIVGSYVRGGVTYAFLGRVVEE